MKFSRVCEAQPWMHTWLNHGYIPATYASFSVPLKISEKNMKHKKNKYIEIGCMVSRSRSTSFISLLSLNQ